MIHHTRMTGHALCLLGLAFLYSGCTFWHDFTTYFNTIYLARHHLEAYEDQQRETLTSTNGAIAVQNHRWLDEEYQTRQLALTEEGRAEPIPPTFSRTLSATKQVANVHLDSAIILGSKVLAGKKSTKYIEDALYIVGKAQFYKNDFAGARRKFLELLYRFPNTKYGADVQVLLSRSMLANHQLDTARVALNAAMALAEQSGDKSALADVHRANAEYIYAKNPDSLAAIAAELHDAAEGLSGDEKSKVAYDEGSVDYFNSDWQKAEAAFRSSYEAASDDWLSGEAHIAHALALRRMLKFKEAYAELAIVATREKYAASRPAARYEEAYTDELADRAEVKGNLRDPIFETKYHPSLHGEYYSLDTAYHNSSALIISRARFRQAEMYREMGQYDSASRLAVPLIGTKDFSSTAMNELVNNRMRSLANFSKWRYQLTRIDSIEHVIETAHPTFKGRNLQTELHMQAIKEVLGGRWRAEVPVPLTKLDSQRVMTTEARLTREHAQQARLVVSDTSRFIDSLHFVGMNAHYQLGHAFETFDEPSDAGSEYRGALAYSFDSTDAEIDSLHAQVLYAWAQLERRQKNFTAADSLLNELYANYGQTVFAEQARKLFSKGDKGSPGESAYAAAYSILTRSGLDAAKLPLTAIATDYSHEDVAPRSLYAIGVSYEEIPKYDSAVVYYRRVLDEYPYSTYAEALRPRLAVAPPKSHGNPADERSSLTDEEKQKLEIQRAQKAREQEIKRQRPVMPGMPQDDPPPTEQNAGNPMSSTPRQVVPPPMIGHPAPPPNK